MMRRAQGGFSLVEAMVAAALGIFLLTGLITFLLANRQAGRMQQAAALLQEDGRFILSVLQRDIRSAGFYGCADMGDVTNGLDPSGTGYSDYDFLNAGPIEGTEGGASPDDITIRFAEREQLSVQAPYGPQTSANIKVDSPNDLEVGDIVLASDCDAGDIFQITSGNPGQNGTVVHNTGAAVEPGNYNPGVCTGGNAHCLSKVYQGDAAIYRMSVVRYFVAAGADGTQALMRTENGTTVEMISGVTDFQVGYGEDSDADGSANRYRDASVAVMNDVVSVRLSVTLESDLISTVGDERLERTFESTIAIRNRLP